MTDSGAFGALSDEKEVQITFVKSSNGKRRSIPVWFTVHEGKMELLPMYGLKTKWLIDVQKSGKVEVMVKDWRMGTKPKIVRDPEAVNRIKHRFGMKYGEDEVKEYYPTSEVALEIALY
jgi:hypothetical protein